ncbi:nuclear transport factor 2 family protein [Cyanobacteria bacterium FACHB-DQ100]|uniref:ketosteroid isomerase family protein n=1 Tax=Leptolyngbya sp. DQ-M1 TaxID=2933920 RepID=UPI0019873384|nr:nuclear transport factor 2 family protein [Cyanobacteria bacterium FACHB-DQ100]
MQTQSIEIEGISHPIILRYFETLNAGEFEATSQLFAIEGAMQPPFEQPIIGREAITAYLQKEAPGLTALPQAGTSHTTDQNAIEFQITGRVQMPMFGVNVTWYFTLDSNDQLMFTRIKLNASPQELMKLRQ